MTARRPRRIDAHQHFWRLARGDYGWLTPALAPIYRDFETADLEPLLRRGGIDATVLVQAAPTVAETRFLLELAARTAFVAGVVGWAPLDAPNAAEVVAELAGDARLRGLRPMLHDIPEVDWMLRPAVSAGLRAIAARDLTFDALVRPPHLSNLRRVLERHPDLRVVIDHGAKPDVAAGRAASWAPWADDMAHLARDTRAWVKLSGLVTEDGPSWSVERLRPYVDHLLDHFGPDRVMFGSDWPVVTLRGGYAEWLAAVEALLGGLERSARDRVLGENAVACYRLPGA
jgi:L-fuconolactonase